MSETMPIVHIVDDDPSFLTAISWLLRANGLFVKWQQTLSNNTL
jgi:FixJ family two-component response regulator